jgi:hypothetical protein
MEFGRKFGCSLDGRLGFDLGKTVITLTLMLAVAGCTRFELESFKAPNLSDAFRGLSVTASTPVGTQGPARAEDLVDAQGNCRDVPMASAAAGVEGSSTDPVTVPANSSQALGGIGLEMTECDVVRRAGAPENMQLGTNERTERTLTLTYIHGTRPGIYSFVAGRLVTIERAPEPPEPTKPVKPAKSAKPKPKPRPAAT